MKYVCLITALLLATAASADTDENGFVRITPDELVWQPLVKGLQMAVLEGDPSKEGYYIIRAKFAPGNFSAPHYHPHDRFITVIKGTWWTSTGPVQDKEHSIPLKPGSYMKHPAGAAHSDGAKDEEVIVEIRGMGPAPLVYVDEGGKPLE